MKTLNDLSCEDARKLWIYNRRTGFLWWKVPASGRPVGKPAGTASYDTKGRKKFISISFKGKKYKAHRLAWLIHYGNWPENEIDHIDQNPFNNAIDNLRDVSCMSNGQNRPMYDNNKSGHVGVCWHKTKKKWTAQIRVKGVLVNLGDFDDKEKAVLARREAEIDHGFHENHGRKREISA